MEEQGSMLGKWLECALGEALSEVYPRVLRMAKARWSGTRSGKSTKTREKFSRREGQDPSEEATGR